jgi:hypothetical protein
MNERPEKAKENVAVCGAPVFSPRALTSVLLMFTLIALVFSGVVLFAAPSGRVAHDTGWLLLGMTKPAWIGMHIWFGLIFSAATLMHIVFNIRALVNYFKNRHRTGLLVVRPEWIAALVVCAVVFIGTRMGLPPFSTLLNARPHGGPSHGGGRRFESPASPNANRLDRTPSASREERSAGKAMGAGARVRERGDPVEH